jgi:hypothetical protein
MRLAAARRQESGAPTRMAAGGGLARLLRFTRGELGESAMGETLTCKTIRRPPRPVPAAAAPPAPTASTPSSSALHPGGSASVPLQNKLRWSTSTTSQLQHSYQALVGHVAGHRSRQREAEVAAATVGTMQHLARGRRRQRPSPAHARRSSPAMTPPSASPRLSPPDPAAGPAPTA